MERLTPGEPVPSGSTNLDNFYLNPKTGRYEQVPEPPVTSPEPVPTVRIGADEVPPPRSTPAIEAPVAEQPVPVNSKTIKLAEEPQIELPPKSQTAPLSREQLEVLTGQRFTDAEFNALVGRTNSAPEAIAREQLEVLMGRRLTDAEAIEYGFTAAATRAPAAAEQPTWLRGVGAWAAEHPKTTLGVVGVPPTLFGLHMWLKDGSGDLPPTLPPKNPPTGGETPPAAPVVVPPKDPPVVVPPPEKKAPPYVPPVVTRGPSDINVPEGGQTPGQGGGGLGGMLSGLIGALSKLFGGSQAPQTTPTTPPTTQPTNPPVVTPTPPKPYVTLIANPTSLLSGRKSLLTWSSVNTSSCELFAPGDISMATGTRGSTSTLALATSTLFRLDCSAPSGATTSAKATVTVQ